MLKYPEIDTRGRACPEPVILAKKALEQYPEGVNVLADNPAARDNVRRFAQQKGYNVEITQMGEEDQLQLRR